MIFEKQASKFDSPFKKLNDNKKQTDFDKSEIIDLVPSNPNSILQNRSEKINPSPISKIESNISLHLIDSSISKSSYSSLQQSPIKEEIILSGVKEEIQSPSKEEKSNITISSQLKS